MKKFSFILVFILLIFLSTPVMALTKEEFSNRSECSSYELAIANADGSATKVECFDNYESALTAMDSSSEDNSIIIYYNNPTKIINAKYAVVNLDRGNTLTYYYPSSTGNDYNTYMNNSSSFYGVDAALIKREDNGRAKIRIAGYTGWVRENDYEIVPYAWVKSTSYYRFSQTSNDNNIYHYYTNNIYNDPTNMWRTFGVSPDIPEGNYFSYDGNYFYADFKTMINDYKLDSFNNAINKDNPYYNYYLYLPHHTKTNYSSLNIDEYMRQIGISGSAYYAYYNGYSWWVGSNASKLYGQGTFFYNAQERYGTNALLMFSLAQNESGNGRSAIAFAKNNIFGLNAYDSNPYYSASGYNNVASSISNYAYEWIAYGYSNPFDSRYHGGILGNKGIGMNVMYASDPYWSEKAASNYYDFDIAMGNSDYNYYQLAITKNNFTKTYLEANQNSKQVYTFNQKGITAVIVDEITVNDLLWYKIISDLTIDSFGNEVGYDSSYNTNYNWNTNYVYVLASDFNKINTSKNGIKKPTDTYQYEDQKYTYVNYDIPKVAITLDNVSLYYDATLRSSCNLTIAKDDYVMVYTATFEENGEVKSYLITSNYNENQKEWVNSSKIKFVNKSYGVSEANYWDYYEEIYDEPNGAMIANGSVGIYTKTYFPILEIKEVNNVKWLKIPYRLTTSNSTAWIMAEHNVNNYEFSVATTIVTYPPVINATDKTIAVGTSFDPLIDVSVTDVEDKTIPNSNVVVISNVNSSVAGDYQVTYKVKDSDFEETTKTINVHVVEYEINNNNYFYYNNLKYVSDDIFEVSGLLVIKGIDNIKTMHSLILKNNYTEDEITLPLTSWTSDVPFNYTNNDNNNYQGGWFKGNVDLKEIPSGNYTLYVEIKTSTMKSRTLFNNFFAENMVKDISTSTAGYLFQTDYYNRNLPIELSLRKGGLLAESLPQGNNRIYNSFVSMNVVSDNLNILGTSHSVNLDYSSNKEVTRKLYFENIADFNVVEYDIGSITTGPYEVILRISDGKNKARAWYDTTSLVDLTRLPVGHYVLYIKTIVDDIEDYGEVNDILYNLEEKSYILSNDRKVTLKRNIDYRYRIEVFVE